ncbi:MAG TPA: 16S rRNA (guanine(527)-N(7))-methyltransferase RsmG [Chitinophagaceae bacterium]|nr:16S rRNA (guanine(527)-N(7))-methyltransferase RsmG [Chitinophagaceae bacterium]
MEKSKQQLEIILKYFSDFTPLQIQQFAALENLYREWNTKINVISRKDIDCLYEKHVLHSLAIAAQFEFLPGTKIIDIGTGGGFPGIPLAIFFPKVSFHLTDSIGKKIKVVSEISAAIGLKNLTAQHTRAEDIKNKKFDYAISRAVAPLKDLWKWGKPLLHKHAQTASNKLLISSSMPNGLICLKGGDLTQEIYESGLKPMIWEIDKIFEEDFFKEKYILFVPFK